MIIDYGDNEYKDKGYDIFYDEENNIINDLGSKKSPSEMKIDGNYKQLTRKPLIEIEVDEEYKLEMVHPKHKQILDELRLRFAERINSPIPLYDLKAAMYAIGNKIDYKLGKFRIQNILRYLWRAGYIRRYVIGKVRWEVKEGRGEWYGIHYSLYPKDWESSNKS